MSFQPTPEQMNSETTLKKSLSSSILFKKNNNPPVEKNCASILNFSLSLLPEVLIYVSQKHLYLFAGSNFFASSDEVLEECSPQERPVNYKFDHSSNYVSLYRIYFKSYSESVFKILKPPITGNVRL